MKFFGRLFLSGVLVFFAACSAADVSSQKQKMTMTQCKDPRPQMCTMDYSPVCGINQDGSKKTYSNGCGACSDVKIIEYYQGSCTVEVR